MKRYSKAFLEKNPHLIGKDVEATRKACEKFKFSPISIMNFVEGTRYTEEKHEKQKSPYTHLLKPKAGGVAFVITMYLTGNKLWGLNAGVLALPVSVALFVGGSLLTRPDAMRAKEFLSAAQSKRTS